MADQFDGNFEEILPDGKLPGDIMVSILLRLPVKSLLKFKAVCKPWCSLISTPRFVKLHLHGNSTSAENSIFSSICTLGGHDEYGLLNDNLYKNHATDDDILVSRIPLPFPYREDEYFRMLDSCNGLVCLGHFRPDKFVGFILWNPATRKYWSFEMTSQPHLVSFEATGLGYVKATNEYKVVWLTSHFTDTFRREMFIYAFSSNSWKKLDYDYDFFLTFAPPVKVNERMHWMTRSTCGTQNLVAAFDVSDEVMTCFMVPDNYASVSKITWQIVAIRDCLAFLVFHNSEVKDIEVWIMTEYGFEGSWAKQFTIDAIPYPLVQPPLSWKDGELLFRYNKDGYLNLMSCDPIRKTKKLHSGFKSRGLFSLYRYTESLMFFEGPQRGSQSIC